MISTTKTRTLAGVAALALALTFVQAANADGIDGPISKTVAYGDSNLDSAGGAKTLYRRIETAARAVCSPLESKDLGIRAAWQTCYDHAIDAAVVKVNNSAVAMVRAQSTGHASAG